MTIKQLAYAAQQHIQSHTGTTLKRAHVYELLAAAFGFGSYAALSAEWLFTQQPIAPRSPAAHHQEVGGRCLDLGYSAEASVQISKSLPALLISQEVGIVRLDTLIAILNREYDEAGTDSEQLPDEADEDALRHCHLLRDGLLSAAAKDSARAHYALALVDRLSDDDYEASPSSDYWFNQARNGPALSAAQQEFADSYAAELKGRASVEHHLREAARLGHQEALLLLAEEFGDDAFFEQANLSATTVDPARIAMIAEQLGRDADTKKWLTVAASKGDTDAMLQLIEEHDTENLQQCWVWLYLAGLLGSDLTQGVAINERGGSYEDGDGAIYALTGIELQPLSPEDDSAALQRAERIFQSIRMKD
ncbi:MAG: hypothetical protein ACI87C_001248 [Paraperlucidibaca sp.]|jgi:hypothetical protein